MIDNNAMMGIGAILLSIVLFRAWAIEEARKTNIRERLRETDEACKGAANMVIIVVMVALGACGLLSLALEFIE